MKVLVLGGSGMIGSTLLRILSLNSNWEIVGSIRANDKSPSQARAAISWVCGVDLTNPYHMSKLFKTINPNVVVNCAGLTKHLPYGNNPLTALNLNALMPHHLAEFCDLTGARLIHVSTDCVFSGKKGNYCEDDEPDATDIYGKTKHLGEVTGPRHVTLRTSTIGHELGTRYGLLEWFLAQTHCKGYQKAIFSGLPTIELARVICDIVIPNDSLQGLYHVGAEAIDKDTLLRLIARVYRKQIDITTDDQVVIDRSLDSKRFMAATGYRTPSWPQMIDAMYQDKC
jgi:dTDP-4-dehydrorhamnose reductase